MMIQKNPSSFGNRGFTLVEMMVAMLISSIILLTAFTVFKTHQNHYINQLDVAEMQQNLRGALTMLSHDIRMAGFDDPDDPVAQIVSAQNDLFYFTYDLNEDGDVDDANEHIAYDLYVDADGIPVLGRTVSNSTISTSTISPGHREVTNPTHQPAAEQIEHLEFYYLNEDGNPTSAPDQIKSVVVTLVARAEQPDNKFSNTQTYSAGSNEVFYVGDPTHISGRTWVKNDNYRRRIAYTKIDCRNIGI